VTRPPGDSLELTQDGHVADPGHDLSEGLRELLARINEEIDFNTAKGSSAYRLGMHDGLRFAEDAVVELLRAHGYEAAQRPRAQDA
jgi:hypothetical protein